MAFLIPTMKFRNRRAHKTFFVCQQNRGVHTFLQEKLEDIPVC
jgi:hypothetical protein